MPNSKRKCRGCNTSTIVTDKAVFAGVMYFCDNNCRINYGINNAKSLATKQKDKREKEARKELRKRKVETKHKATLLQEAQYAFNRYVRTRDKYNGQRYCICCKDRVLDWSNPQACDSGHFLAVGGNGGLRFNLWNVHAQSSYCNRYRGGDSGYYRDNLIDKIGLERVEALENSTARGKYSNEYLERIKRIFRKKTRMIEKRMANA